MPFGIDVKKSETPSKDKKIFLAGLAPVAFTKN